MCLNAYLSIIVNVKWQDPAGCDAYRVHEIEYKHTYGAEENQELQQPNSLAARATTCLAPHTLLWWVASQQQGESNVKWGCWE